jgi:predicted AlkP superfamily pyrophosphatase or phosphodiesterase
MKRILAGLMLFSWSVVATAGPAAPQKPKLIVAVVVDQFRYDYLLRFRADYTSGFRKILEQGAVFDNAHLNHYPTVTAVGHSTFLSGATPSLSGIVANEWYDRETGKTVTSVSDPATKLLGTDANAAGSSPRRMIVTTVGDQIKMSGQQSKVIGISIKDRAAILPAGHAADGAYWFDDRSGHWVTSSYYMDTLPVWVNQINEGKPAAKAQNGMWYPVDAKPGAAKAFCTMAAATAETPKCRSFEATPWGNEVIEDFAEHALAAEKLGQHSGTDILAVSFSANDYVGHAMGPDSPEVRDISIRTDRLLGKLLDDIDKTVGLNNVVFVLTADHGVVPVPEVSVAGRMNGGRLSAAVLQKAMEDALAAKYGAGKWIVNMSATGPYLNRELIESKKLDEAEVEKTAAEAASKTPHVFRVYTSDQIINGQVAGDSIETRIRNGVYPGRSSDLFIIQEPGYLYEAGGTSHGTPFNYDTHVPLIFMGPGIKPGHYYEEVAANDIAPTLAAIARVQEPDGSIGRVLQEMWQ